MYSNAEVVMLNVVTLNVVTPSVLAPGRGRANERLFGVAFSKRLTTKVSSILQNSSNDFN